MKRAFLVLVLMFSTGAIAGELYDDFMAGKSLETLKPTPNDEYTWQTDLNGVRYIHVYHVHGKDDCIPYYIYICPAKPHCSGDAKSCRNKRSKCLNVFYHVLDEPTNFVQPRISRHDGTTYWHFLDNEIAEIPFAPYRGKLKLILGNSEWTCEEDPNECLKLPIGDARRTCLKKLKCGQHGGC